MRQTKQGFTLIEVLVSVVILSVVAVGLFDVSSKGKQNYIFLKEKTEFDRLSSLALMHNDQKKYHNKEKTLYDFIRYDYNIDDDDLRKYLKTKKVNYRHKEVSTFKPLDDKASEEFKEEQAEEDPDAAEVASFITLTLVYEKITISDKHNSTYAYKIYIKNQ